MLDFTKAFDKVPHRRLLSKLRLPGLDGPIWNCFDAFLSDRTQQVLVEGQYSRDAEVISGVPQGTVMGTLLFLLFITTRSLSWTQLLATICKWLPYLPGSPQHRRPAGIATIHWCPWEVDHTLGVYFNPTKCSVKTIFRSTLITKMYQLHNTIPAKVDSIVYLGIAISSELSWSAQISACTKETNATLGFIRQNLSTAAEKGILHLPGEFSYGLQHHRLEPPTPSRM